jgi:hypothetical protein
MVKVFISWSGDDSREVASALAHWLPDVIQNVSTWMSEHDIEAGARWSYRLNEILDQSNIGVICLTPSNLMAPWILFEAGALSKSIKESRVIPYLLGISTLDVAPPLSQFQAVGVDKAGTLKLVESINAASGEPMPPERVKRLFEKWWPDFETRITDAKKSSLDKAKPYRRSDREILDEVLQLVRSTSAMHTRYESNYISAGHIEIDTRPIFGDAGKVSRVSFFPDKTVSDFLDDIYLLLNKQETVRSYAYGDVWLLKNSRTGQVFDNIGIEYCKSKGEYRDDTPIYILEIEDSDRLLVIPGPGR